MGPAPPHLTSCLQRDEVLGFAPRLQFQGDANCWPSTLPEVLRTFCCINNSAVRTFLAEAAAINRRMTRLGLSSDSAFTGRNSRSLALPSIHLLAV